MRRLIPRHGDTSERGDRGSTLLLFPAGVLIVMVLSAIAVDLTQVQAGRRELQRSVNAAADDAASHVDLDAYYASRGIGIDLDRARRSVTEDLDEALHGRGIRLSSVRVEGGPTPDRITVRVVAEVPHLFARVVPGAPRTERITAAVAAVLAIRPVDRS